MKTDIQKVVDRKPVRIITASLKSHNTKNTEVVFIRDFTGRPDYNQYSRP